MSDDELGWDARVEAVWKSAESMQPAALVSTIDALAALRDENDAAALFERASARDSAGLESAAEEFYRAALAAENLDPFRRARASIQLASTLRILGRLAESEKILLTLLDAHMEAGSSRTLHDEARAILALTYVAQGRAVEAAGLALRTLAPHLSRYNRSISGNAGELVKNTWD